MERALDSFIRHNCEPESGLVQVVVESLEEKLFVNKRKTIICRGKCNVDNRWYGKPSVTVNGDRADNISDMQVASGIWGYFEDVEDCVFCEQPIFINLCFSARRRCFFWSTWYSPQHSTLSNIACKSSVYPSIHENPSVPWSEKRRFVVAECSFVH